MMSNVCTVLFKGVIFLDFGLKGHKIVGFYSSRLELLKQ